MSKNWENYGDCNPIDYDGLWLKETGEGVFDFIKTYNLKYACDEKGWLFGWGTIDINDSWIDITSVLDFSGIDRAEELEDIILAREIINYYGADNFGGVEERFLHRRDVVKAIRHSGIELEEPSYIEALQEEIQSRLEELGVNIEEIKCIIKDLEANVYSTIEEIKLTFYDLEEVESLREVKEAIFEVLGEDLKAKKITIEEIF